MMEPQRRITNAYFRIALEQYQPMIYRLASIVGFNYSQSDDFMSQARTELLKCMICYQNIGSFITFFWSRLFGAFKHMKDIERRTKKIQTISLGEISDFPTNEYDMDVGIMVEECLECLNREERNVVVELFFRHKTIKQISDDSNIAVANLYRTKKRAIGKMKNKCVVG